MIPPRSNRFLFSDKTNSWTTIVWILVASLVGAAVITIVSLLGCKLCRQLPSRWGSTKHSTRSKSAGVDVEKEEFAMHAVTADGVEVASVEEEVIYDDVSMYQNIDPNVVVCTRSRTAGDDPGQWYND